MKPKDRETMTGMLNKLNDKETLAEAKAEVIKDPVQGLFDTTSNFVKSRFSYIEEDNDFESIIKTAIMDKIKNNPDQVTMKDLSYLLNQVKEKNNVAVEGLLNFFKPNNGDSLPLLASQPTEKSIEDQTYESADHATLQAVEHLNQILMQVKSSQAPSKTEPVVVKDEDLIE